MTTSDLDYVKDRLYDALTEAGVNYAETTDLDVYVEWYLSDLLEFVREWRSEIEELG